MRSFLANPWTRRLAALCIIAAFVLLPSASHAENSLISGVAGSVISKGVASILYYILAFVAWSIGALSEGLNMVLHFQLDANLVVIVDLWKIVRDFANMMFILIFIIMALGTIFDISSLGIPGLGGGVDVKALIAKFVIAALLINFSLVIGGVIIDAANVVNDVFLAAIGDFSTRIGSALNPSATLLGVTPQQLQQLNVNVSAAPADPGLAHIIKMLTSIIMGVIILFSLLVALVFCLFRIPFLAMLLVFSPLAWICGILPGTQKWNKDWWGMFIGWNIFMPVFLFFLYFGLYFLAFQDQLLGSIAVGFDPTSVTGVVISGFNVTVQTIFYYFIVAFTLIGGTKVAVDAASGGGKWLTNTVAASRNLVWGAPPFSQLRAYGQARKMELEQIQKEGLGSQKVRIPFGDTLFGKKDLTLGATGDFIYGGKRGQERLLERTATRLGVKGYEGDKLLAKKIAEKRKDFKEKDLSVEKLLSNVNDLRNRNDQDSLADYYASVEVLLEKKRLPFEMANGVLGRYKSHSKPAAGAFQDRLADQILDKANKEGFQSDKEFSAAYSALPADTRERFLKSSGSRNMAWSIDARLKTLAKEYDDEVTKRKEKGLVIGKSDDIVLEEIMKESMDTSNPNNFRTSVAPVVDALANRAVNPKSPEAEKILIDALAGGFSNRDLQNLMSDPALNIDGINTRRSKSKLDDMDKKELAKVEKIYKALGLQLNEKRVLDIGKNLSAQQRRNFDALVKDVMVNIQKNPKYKADFDSLKKGREEAKKSAKEFAKAVGDAAEDKASTSSGRKGGPAGFRPSGS